MDRATSNRRFDNGPSDPAEDEDTPDGEGAVSGRPGTLARPELARALSPLQLFTIATGGIGVGWIIVVGDWLQQAGPLGAITGFLAGAAIIVPAALCYAEMASSFPVTGGEMVYCYEVYGAAMGFGMGWFTVLAYVVITAFEAISIGWVMTGLVPGSEGPLLGTVAGQPLRAGSLAMGVLGTWGLAYINYRGINWSAKVQDALSWIFLGAASIFIATGVFGGSLSNLDPGFARTASGAILPGILAVFLTTPNFLTGFAFVPQLMEELAPGSSARAAGPMLLSVIVRALFFCLVILACAMAVPWPTLVGTRLPAAEAFQTAFRSAVLAKVVLLAGFLGLVMVWNAVIISGSRVLFALGRARFLHPAFSRTQAGYRTPGVAIGFVALCATVGIFLGRRALIPILTVTSAVQAAAFVLIAIGIIRLRRSRPELPRPYRIRGGQSVAVVAAVGSAGALWLAITEPYKAVQRGIPLEWWIIVVWGVLGLLFWFLSRGTRLSVSEAERRRLILGEVVVRSGGRPDQGQ